MNRHILQNYKTVKLAVISTKTEHAERLTHAFCVVLVDRIACVDVL